jgi:hypothetical protein
MPSAYHQATASTGVGLSLNSPELNPDGGVPETPPVRAVKDYDQAAQLVGQLVNDNADRNTINARITSAYNAEKPWSDQSLKEDGLDYKNNFSTQVLPQLVDRVAPRFVRAISEAKYLTNSSLPDSVPGASKKTEAFRREITSLVRSHPEWDGFIAELAQENCLFGYTAAGWTDEYAVVPTHFRGDRFFIPVGTKQISTNAPAVVLMEPFLPNELFEKIQDKDAATAAGWEWGKTVEMINRALPDSVASHASEDARIYEDLARENTFAAGLSERAKVIKVYNLFVMEVTGSVTHFKLAHSEGGFVGIFRRDDRFKSMAEVSAFYAFQSANGTMHGSKGIGRIVYNMAKVIDRARNEVLDRLQLSGKVILSGEPKDIRKFRMTVLGNVIILPKTFEISQHSIDPRVEEFFSLDTYMTTMLDQLAGNVSPRQLQGERVTAKQVELFAAREEEAKDTPIMRFLGQFARMVSEIQRRAINPETTFDRAKEMQERLLKVMTREELEQIASRPSAQVVLDLTEMQRQQVILVAAENQGNPLVNQTEMKRRQLTAQIDEQFAEAVLMPENDPVQAAEQTRAQQLENLLLTQGMEVPVSPRDSHRLHLDMLWPNVDQVMQGLLTDPASTQPLLQVLLGHARTHVQLGIAAGGDESFAGDQQKLNTIAERLAALQQHEQTLQEAAAAGLAPEQALAAAAEASGGVQGAAGGVGAPGTVAP